MPCDYTTIEVKQLWWFLDGAIMSVDVRLRLHAAWGFCPRHTWAYLIAQCELHLMPRGGLVLYEDLVSRAAEALEARRWRSRFTPSDVCLTCEYLKIGNQHRVERSWITDTEEVNRALRTSQLAELDRAHWEPRTCPDCLGGSGPRCMAHLLAAHDSRSVSAAERKGTVAALHDIRGRLETTLASICWPRRPVAPGGWAALIEAVGWFGGWQGVTQIPAPPDPAASTERADLLYASAGTRW